VEESPVGIDLPPRWPNGHLGLDSRPDRGRPAQTRLVGPRRPVPQMGGGSQWLGRRFYHRHYSTPPRNPTDREGAASDGKVPPAPPLTTTSLHCITILHRHLVHHSDTMKAGILSFSISLSSPSRSSTKTCHQCEVVPQ
jgi:hypothetical protein